MATPTRPRIGFAGLSCECCTFSPCPSGERDFVLLDGDELLASYQFLARYPAAEFVPLLRARALPGGPIEPDFYDQFKGRLLRQLTDRGPWDGLFLHLHGAANVMGRDDLEGDLVVAIRQQVGPRCLISASYDLHGNLSQCVAENLDILTAYRTAPHVDWLETLERACSLLVRCLVEGLRPTLSFIPVPILLPGEQTSTEFEPAASLYAAIPSLVADHGILDASVLIGYVWADEPRATGSVVALGLEPDRTQAAAVALARRFWDVRHGFQFGVRTGSTDECVGWALEPGACPVVISDSGDNPTAGGAGDIPFVLERLLAGGVEEALVAGIADGAAVAVCEQAGAGAEVTLELGGKLDPVHGSPLLVTGSVVSVHTVPWEVGAATDLTNEVAVVQSAGVHVIITQRRTTFHHLSDFTRLALDPHDFAIIVVKMGYLVPELSQLAGRSLLALSPGAVSQDVRHLPFERIRRPMYPLDPDLTWQPPTRQTP